jgi:hypothetical protein
MYAPIMPQQFASRNGSWGRKTESVKVGLNVLFFAVFIATDELQTSNHGFPTLTL